MVGIQIGNRVGTGAGKLPKSYCTLITVLNFYTKLKINEFFDIDAEKLKDVRTCGRYLGPVIQN